MTQTPHIDPPEFTASERSLWAPAPSDSQPGVTVMPMAREGPWDDAHLDRAYFDIIMTGHQAGFWHCGILAKTLAANALITARPELQSARLVHLVVDQDDNDAGLIEYPARDASGAIVVRQWRVAPQVEGTPTGLRPAVRDVVAPADGARDFVNQGLAEIASSLRSRTDQPSLAMQMAHAAHDIIAARCPGMRPWQIINARAISGGGAFEWLIGMIMDNPRACVEAYNAAAAEFPNAGVRPLSLHSDEGRIELPLWRFTPEGRRVSARVADVRIAVESRDFSNVAPKALFMTAFVRTQACHLFVHGTGGGVYDRVMERWLALWEPRLAGRPAPAVVATATVRLPLLHTPVPSEAEVARARWLAHAARHNPAVLEDGDAAARKALLLANVRGGTRATRMAAYRSLHEAISHYRTTRAPDIRRLADEAARLAHLRAGAGPALRRTWAFPLFPRDATDALQNRAHQWFAGT